MDNQKEKEIDLVQILSTIWNGIANICTWCVDAVKWSLRFAYKHRIGVCVSVVLAILFTMFWGRPANRSSKMETEMRINVQNSFFFHDVIASLDYMCKYQDTIRIAKELNLPMKHAKKLLGVKSYYFVDKLCDGTPDEICMGNFEADTTKQIMTDRLLLNMEVRDTLSLKSIEDGILYYFENNSLIEKANKERIEESTTMLANVEKELFMLDSLRKNEYFNKKEKSYTLGGNMIVTEKEKQLFHDEILRLSLKKNQCVYELNVNSKCVNFIRPFVMTDIKNGYVSTFAKSFVVFLILVMVFCWFSDQKKNIVKFLEKED